MKNHFNITLSVIFIIILNFAIFFPLHVENSLVELILLATPVAFAIFIGFSMEDRKDRLDKIRENDSIERSTLEFIYRFSALYNKENHTELVEAIDQYLMGTLDNTIWNYSKTQPQFNNLILKIISIGRKENDKEAYSIDTVGNSDTVGKMLEAREQSINLIADRLSGFEWLLYAFLSLGVVLPFLIVNDGSVVSVLLIICLTLIVLLLLRLLYIFDSLSWKEEIRIFEPYQKTFEAIGKPRYYPEILLQTKRIRNLPEVPYRVGSYTLDHTNGVINKSVKVVNM